MSHWIAMHTHIVRSTWMEWDKMNLEKQRATTIAATEPTNAILLSKRIAIGRTNDTVVKAIGVPMHCIATNTFAKTIQFYHLTLFAQANT